MQQLVVYFTLVKRGGHLVWRTRSLQAVTLLSICYTLIKALVGPFSVVFFFYMEQLNSLLELFDV